MAVYCYRHTHPGLKDKDTRMQRLKLGNRKATTAVDRMKHVASCSFCNKGTYTTISKILLHVSRVFTPKNLVSLTTVTAQAYLLRSIYLFIFIFAESQTKT
jgi:hypothetical protein